MTSVNNIILDFGVRSNEINALATRLKNKNESYEIVKVTPGIMQGKPTNREIEAFKKVDINTRVYIYAHGGLSRPDAIVGYEFPESHQNEIDFSYQQVSDYLGSRLGKNESVTNSEKHLKISIIACHAGLITELEKRFAIQLHEDLAERKALLTDILARKNLGTMVTSPGEHIGKKIVRSAEEKTIDVLADSVSSNFEKWVSSSANKPGTKIKLTWTPEGEQIVKDAYSDKFYELSRKACDEIKSFLDTTNIENKDQLNQGIDAISALIQQENISFENIINTYLGLKDIELQMNQHVKFESKNLKKSSIVANKYINHINREQALSLFKEQALNICTFQFLDSLGNKKITDSEKLELKIMIKQIIADINKIDGNTSDETFKNIFKNIRNVTIHDVFKNDKQTSRMLDDLANITKIYISNREPIQTKKTGYKHIKTS